MCAHLSPVTSCHLASCCEIIVVYDTGQVWVWVCSLFLADFAPDELEVGVREHILQDLETFVRRQFAGEVNPHLHCLTSFSFQTLI